MASSYNFQDQPPTADEVKPVDTFNSMDIMQQMGFSYLTSNLHIMNAIAGTVNSDLCSDQNFIDKSLLYSLAAGIVPTLISRNTNNRLIDPTLSSVTSVEYIPCGGSCEGGSFARLFQPDGSVEVDFLVVPVRISSQSQIVDLSYAPGFVNIHHDDGEIGSKFKEFFHKNSNNHIYFDGVQFKRHLYQSLATKKSLCNLELSDTFISTNASAPCSVLFTQDQSTLNDIYSKIFQQVKRNQYSLLRQQIFNYSQLLHKSVNSIHQLMMIDNYSAFFPNLINNQLNTFFAAAPEFLGSSMNKQSVELCCAFMAPAFGIPLPDKLKQKIKVVIDFYCKYQHLSDRHICQTIQKDRCTKIEYDHVLALQLNFIPRILEDFLNRVVIRHWYLIEQMLNDNTDVFILVVSKPSKKCPKPVDERFEFRYSFSMLEVVIANNRTTEEKTLNTIARIIYFRVIRPIVVDDEYIPSYFVKTTVLWLCETMHLQDTSRFDDEDLITMGQWWMAFAIEKLSSHYCQHYFLSDVNILEHYSSKLVQTVSRTLQSLTNLPIFDNDTIDVIEQNDFDFDEDDIKRKQQEEGIAYDKYREMLVNDFPHCRHVLYNNEKCFLNAYRSCEFGSVKFWRQWEELFLDFVPSDKIEPYTYSSFDEIPFSKFYATLYASVIQLKNVMTVLPYLNHKFDLSNVDPFPHLSRLMNQIIPNLFNKLHNEHGGTEGDNNSHNIPYGPNFAYNQVLEFMKKERYLNLDPSELQQMKNDWIGCSDQVNL
ncbi:unnamed protein product, partial [Didymodactylos carnosus]